MSSLTISIITPSFNQAQFLPINLNSVANQKSANIEHIIVDPGSTDGSTKIAREFPNIKLIAEPDSGQSDGICKGFSQSTGDILVWLNSDDFYPNANVISTVLKTFNENPDVDIVYGDVDFVDEKGKFLRKGFINKNSKNILSSFEYQVGIVQPAVFWRRKVFEEIGGPSEEFEYCMDYELWVRMASKGYKWKYIPTVLAHHRWWDGMKTSSRRDLSLLEHFNVCDRYFGYVHWKWLDRYADYLCSDLDGVVNHAKTINTKKKKSAIKKVIDEIVTQEMLYKLTTSKKSEHKKTLKFIEKYHPQKQRIYFQSKELKIISEVSDDPKATERVAWNIFDVKTSSGNRFVSYHVPDNFDRYFAHDWHRKQLNRSKRALSKLRKEKCGDTCIVVGNGPSLRKNDLSLLEGFDTIVSNFASLSPELAKYAKILTVVNDLVAKQGTINFNTNKIIKFVPFWLANYINQSPSTFYVNATVRPEFATNFVQFASWRSTVSFFNLQLAYAIGYKKVILIGFDNSYVQPKEMTEGTLISQIEDDENHFDPRYFKGKDWQAADTVNMEKMYSIAKTVFEKDKREIVNCTVGGKLELFRREDLAKELGVKIFPRLLMIDSTPVNHNSATGQLKKTFLSGWNKSKFLQVWLEGSSKLHTIDLNQSIKNSQLKILAVFDILEQCKTFNPDVIYFRPIDSPLLFDIVEQLLAIIKKPLVIHMMDDWPTRLQSTDEKNYTKLNDKLQHLVQLSRNLLSISDAMSNEFSIRYGGKWKALANGIDIKDYSEPKYPLPLPKKSKPFIIRYMGGLADDMSYQSVKDVAMAVKSLQKQHYVTFEIYTMSWYLDKAKKELAIIPGVQVNELVSSNKYIQLLQESSCLLIAYNFDYKSIQYTGLSLANKMPECFASSVPILAYGPSSTATIRYISGTNCAQIVAKKDEKVLYNKIEELIINPTLCENLGRKARVFSSTSLTKSDVKNQFYNAIHSNSEIMTPKTTQNNSHKKEEKQYIPNILKQPKIVPGAHFRKRTSSVWEFRNSSAKQKLWMAIFNFNPLKESEYVAHITLESEIGMTISVSIGRQGDSEYEGKHTLIKLEPNKTKAVKINYQFKNNHESMKLQLDVVDFRGKSSSFMTIESYTVIETVNSFSNRISLKSMNSKIANKLFREGDYLTAMYMYLILSQRNDLTFYLSNALMAAKKLKLANIHTEQDLLNYVS
ncbi:MAG: glycosyltransferase [Cocleimonas sp.]